MEYREKNGVGYLLFPEWETLSSLRHAFSTKIGGVSKQEFSSMNLSFSRGDPDENVLENYRRFCAAAGFAFSSLVSSAQTHTVNLRRVTKADCGKGILFPGFSDVDGIYTNEPGITLVTHYADCVPLYFYDPKTRSIALSHAGWRGTAGNMAEKTVNTLIREFKAEPETILAAIGPSICGECYEVSDDVAAVFSALCPECVFRREKAHVDLRACNRRLLLQAGIREEHITLPGRCTRCESELLFSHRATNGKRGGLAAFLSMEE